MKINCSLNISIIYVWLKHRIECYPSEFLMLNSPAEWKFPEKIGIICHSIQYFTVCAWIYQVPTLQKKKLKLYRRDFSAKNHEGKILRTVNFIKNSKLWVASLSLWKQYGDKYRRMIELFESIKSYSVKLSWKKDIFELSFVIFQDKLLNLYIPH